MTVCYCIINMNYVIIDMDSENDKRLARNERHRLVYASMDVDRKKDLLAKNRKRLRDRRRMSISFSGSSNQIGASVSGKYFLLDRLLILHGSFMFFYILFFRCF